MQFDWSGLSSEDWVSYCASVENNTMYEDTYIGCARVGELCFDLVTRLYEITEGIVLTYDLYVGGVDTGYGYSRIEPDYPYDFADGSDFEDTCISLSYDGFKELAEKEFERYIREMGQIFYPNANLTEKAAAPLHIW